MALAEAADVIVSFAWTSTAFQNGKKTVTRRLWTDKHAAKFKVGDVFDAWDKSPHRGGERIGAARVVSIEREPLARLVTNRWYAWLELSREGGLWQTPEEFVAAFLAGNGLKPEDLWTVKPYRLEFVKVSQF